MKRTALPSKFDELRRLAEEMLHERGAGGTAESPGIDILSLIHELEVHQIELQMQMEELQQTRRKLEESRKEYADLYELAPVGYVTINRKGVIMRANLMASDMLHTPKKDLIHRGLSKFVHSEDHGAYFALIREIAGVKVTKRTGEFRFLRTRTLPFYAQVEVMPSRDGSGQFTGWRIGFVDVSARKQMEELRANEQKIKNFAYMVAHDIKNPLIGIHWLVSKLYNDYRDNLDDRGNKYCELVVKVSEDILALLDTINSFIETKGAPLKIQTILIGDIIKEIKTEFGPRLNDRNIDWREPAWLPEIKADRLSLLRVFRNFVDNSLKHGGSGLSVIEIQYKEREKDHVFCVADDGAGIEWDSADKLFDPFERPNSSYGIEGTGLGLAIVKEIARNHLGDAWSERRPEGGACFCISVSKELDRPPGGDL